MVVSELYGAKQSQKVRWLVFNGTCSTKRLYCAMWI